MVKNKIKYIVEVNDPELVPFETLEEAEIFVSLLSNHKQSNSQIINQEEFKEIYGKYFKE
jgi:hypothetical protein